MAFPPNFTLTTTRRPSYYSSLLENCSNRPRSRISCNERGKNFKKESAQGRKKKKFAMTHCGFAREASDALYARTRLTQKSQLPSSHSVSLLQDSIWERERNQIAHRLRLCIAHEKLTWRVELGTLPCVVHASKPPSCGHTRRSPLARSCGTEAPFINV